METFPTVMEEAIGKTRKLANKKVISRGEGSRERELILIANGNSPSADGGAREREGGKEEGDKVKRSGLRDIVRDIVTPPNLRTCSLH